MVLTAHVEVVKKKKRKILKCFHGKSPGFVVDINLALAAHALGWFDPFGKPLQFGHNQDLKNYKYYL